MRQPTGYRAFIPAPIPPEPALQFDDRMIRLLSRADQMLGRLDGVSRTIPNPDLFVAVYVRREAVLSSQIEGTQSTLEDVLEYELSPPGRDLPGDVEEVVNYVRAMNQGLARLEDLPLSLRLLREMHAMLLDGVRGQDRNPGEFRTSQNWIGPAEVPLARATFVPPPAAEMREALGQFELFLHQEGGLPDLIHCGLAHAQFETIHPFLDGNGRVGRLLITFLLVYRGVIRRPLLYLSHYFKVHRTEYYDRLQATRDEGDWEGWLRFFLKGVADTAEEATETARRIVRLRQDHRQLIQDQIHSTNALRALDLLFERPIVNAALISDRVDVTFATANNLLGRFERLGLVEEITGGRRNRIFRYAPYLALFVEEAASEGEGPRPGSTEQQTLTTAARG